MQVNDSWHVGLMYESSISHGEFGPAQPRGTAQMSHAMDPELRKINRGAILGFPALHRYIISPRRPCSETISVPGPQLHKPSTWLSSLHHLWSGAPPIRNVVHNDHVLHGWSTRRYTGWASTWVS